MPAKGKSKDKSESLGEDRIPTVLDLELFDYIPKSRAQQKRERFETKLGELFQIFEREEGTKVDVRDVGTILRGMGLNPSEAVVLQIIEEVEGQESSGTVPIPKLKEVIISILMTNMYREQLMVRDDEERILNAFQALDHEGKGYLEADYLRQVMTTMGERFSAEEVTEMVSAAADPETGHIYYDDFAAFMANE